MGSKSTRLAGELPPAARAAVPLVKALREKKRLPRKVFSRHRCGTVPRPCHAAHLTAFSERAIAGWENGQVISEPGLRRGKEL